LCYKPNQDIQRYQRGKKGGGGKKKRKGGGKEKENVLKSEGRFFAKTSSSSLALKHKRVRGEKEGKKKEDKGGRGGRFFPGEEGKRKKGKKRGRSRSHSGRVIVYF